MAEKTLAARKRVGASPLPTRAVAQKAADGSSQ